MFNRYNNIKFTKNEFHYKLSEYIRRNVMYPKRIDDIMFMKTFRGVLESITQLVTTRLYLITKQHNNMILSHYDDNTGTCCCVKRIRAVTPIWRFFTSSDAYQNVFLTRVRAVFVRNLRYVTRRRSISLHFVSSQTIIILLRVQKNKTFRCDTPCYYDMRAMSLCTHTP